MGRIRTIKPEFFLHEKLVDLEQQSGLPVRLAYIGLWCQADREGRFEWRPRRLKAQILPYDEVDFEAILEALAAEGFLYKYEVEAHTFGCIPTWSQHQCINQREAQSRLPAPGDARARTCTDGSFGSANAGVRGELRETVLARDHYRCVRCRRTEDLTIDHIFPRCIGGTSVLTNLRTLCRSCNSKRPVAGEALIADLARDDLTLDDLARICLHVQDDESTCGKEGKGKEHGRDGKESARAGTPRYTRDIYQSFAESQPGIRNAAAYATTISKSGEADDLVKAWLAGKNGKEPRGWREFYRGEIAGLLRDLTPEDPRRGLVDEALAAVDGEYEQYRKLRDRMLEAGLTLA